MEILNLSTTQVLNWIAPMSDEEAGRFMRAVLTYAREERPVPLISHSDAALFGLIMQLDGYHFDWIREQIDASALQTGRCWHEFWALFPRKDAKKDAMKAWLGALKVASPKVILDGAKRLAVSFDGRPKSDIAKWCPMPATWLRGARWNDASLQPSAQPFDPVAAMRAKREAEEGAKP